MVLWKVAQCTHRLEPVGCKWWKGQICDLGMRNRITNSKVEWFKEVSVKEVS